MKRIFLSHDLLSSNQANSTELGIKQSWENSSNYFPKNFDEEVYRIEEKLSNQNCEKFKISQIEENSKHSQEYLPKYQIKENTFSRNIRTNIFRFLDFLNKIDKFLDEILNVLLPIKKVAAKEEESLYVAPILSASSDSFLSEDFDTQDFVNEFQMDNFLIEKPKGKVLEKPENWIITAGDLPLEGWDEEDDSSYHILWSYYHDTEHMFADTWEEIPYTLEVDEQGNLLFLKKNITSLSMINNTDSEDNGPKVSIKYNIKMLLDQTPAVIPGLEDVIFTVSVTNNIVAIDPNGATESTSLKAAQEHPERFRKNSIFLHK